MVRMMATGIATTSRSKLRGRPLAIAAGTRPGRMMATLLWLRTRAERKMDGAAVDMIDACFEQDPRAQLRMIVGDVSLTPRLWDALEFVWRFLNDHGRGPTSPEMSNALGISKTAAYELIERLVAEGVLKRTAEREWRGLRVVDAAERIARGL